MFGLFASKITHFVKPVFAVGLFLVVGAAVLLLASPAMAQSQKATVIHEDAIVYSDADFDAPMIGTLKLGSVYEISLGRKGPFYKIRIKPGMTAWIADNDIRPNNTKNPSASTEKSRKKKAPVVEEEEDPISPKRRPFDEQRFRGLGLEMIQYKEDTLGSKQSQGLLFYGFQFAGPNTLFSGDVPIESNILFHSGAPNYYNTAPGHGGTGWIIITDFLFQTTNPAGTNFNYFYGFGPVLKYSHFDLSLMSGGKSGNYAADDVGLGAVFNLGMGFRIFNNGAVRLEGKYYWEKQMYPALSLSFLWAF